MSADKGSATRASGGRAARAEHTRQRIVETAQRLFAERGYEATSLQSIADEVGLTKAAVYYHFRTKADIAQALIKPLLDAARAVHAAAGQFPRGPERRGVLIDGFADVLVAHRHTLGLIFADPVIQEGLRTRLRGADALEQGALELLYGSRPTARQRAGYLLSRKVVMVLPALAELSDRQLRRVLVDLTRDLWAPEAR